MKRPCIDCGSLIRSGSRCRKHVRAKERERNRPNSTQRGYDARWRAEARTMVENADGCEQCGGEGTEDDPLTVDHITPLARGGTNERANCRVIHRSENSAKRDRID